jgi:hypothetical protein
VAKTSFYFFFNSKEEYLNQLFAYWEMDGTDRIYAMVNRITDPVKRFLALGKMIDGNVENEHFYFQLKLYAKEHKYARIFLDSVSKKRINIATKIFKDAGFSDEEAEAKRRVMKVMTLGHQALMMGYDPDPLYPENTIDDILGMFGLKKP